MSAHDERASNIQLLRATLARYGDEATGGHAPEQVAQSWLEAGFEAEESEEWLAARCFNPDVARALELAGFTPEQAALRTTRGAQDYEETIAYKVARGDLSLEEARRIITSSFWND